jgi:hypothetical protein
LIAPQPLLLICSVAMPSTDGLSAVAGAARSGQFDMIGSPQPETWSGCLLVIISGAASQSG